MGELVIAGGAGERQERVAIVSGVVQAVAFDEQSSDGVYVVIGAGGDESSGEEATNEEDKAIRNYFIKMMSVITFYHAGLRHSAFW